MWYCQSSVVLSEQCGTAASKGNNIIGLIRRNITFKEKANYTYVQSKLVR